MKMKSLLLTSLSLFPLPATAAIYLSGGHIDAPAFAYVSLAEAANDPTLTPGFEPHLHNEGGPDGAILNGVRQEDASEYEPEEIIILIPQTSTTTLNSQTYYWLPENETDAAEQNAPFIGIGLEELDPDDWDGSITIKLTGITGPGNFLLWQSGFPAETLFLDSTDLNLSFMLTPGSHTHFNWGFTEIGLYELQFTIEGTHFDDGFQSATANYQFQVVPEPSTVLLGGLGLLALMRRKR
jgi:surface-anchored protein